MTQSPNAQESKVTQVPLLDIPRGNEPMMDEIQAAIARVCQSGWFVGGPDCKELEQAVADVSGAKYGIGCASGSEALLVSLMAYDIRAGDEVIMPSFTFFATASAVWRLGATPVFVDIEPGSFNIDAAKIEEKITSRTKGIIPVHLFGQCADMDAIMALAKQHDLFVIEDSAQSIGAQFNGREAGGIGDIGCTSFYPTKNLGGFGDGGMMTTNDESLADRLRLLANHGMRPRYYHDVVGINSRLDSIQAAALNVKIKHLSKWSTQRRENAQRYETLFQEAGLDQVVQLPSTAARCFHVWNQYTVRIAGGNRDAIREKMMEAKVGTEVYYPVSLHQQKCFGSLGYEAGSLPETERASSEVLSLPIFPELTIEEQRRVVSQLSECIDTLKPQRLAS